MAAAGGDLVTAVDAVVAEDLSVLSVPALQEQGHAPPGTPSAEGQPQERR